MKMTSLLYATKTVLRVSMYKPVCHNGNIQKHSLTLDNSAYYHFNKPLNRGNLINMASCFSVIYMWGIYIVFQYMFL